ncbi:MAG: aminoacyl-tRNA hydrolase [Planctomycetota bacterium]
MGVKVVLGIGNPGARHQGTRHNLGCEVVRELAWRFRAAPARVRFRGRTAVARRGAHLVVLLEPQTFVNRSGRSARAALEHYDLSPRSLMVVGDDVNLPPGKLRARRGGSSGGHNGLKSVIGHCGTDAFPRVRIGIGTGSGTDLVAHVLGPIGEDERTMLDAAVRKAADTVTAWIDGGIDLCVQTAN